MSQRHEVARGIVPGHGPANVTLGWVGMIAGAASGAIAGLFFHRDDWLGGYASFRRRMVRLGHISLFGLGILNVLYGLSAEDDEAAVSAVGSRALLIGLATMPVVCFLAAWRRGWRHLFFVPVGSVCVGLLCAAQATSRRVIK